MYIIPPFIKLSISRAIITLRQCCVGGIAAATEHTEGTQPTMG
jgi:hypothetical protein